MAVGTIANNAQTLAALYDWANLRGINLDDRFREGKFLRQWEVAELADYIRVEVKTQGRDPRGKVQRFRPWEPAQEPQVLENVSTGVGNYRIEMAAEYLYWLATQSAHRAHNEQRKDAAVIAERLRDEMYRQFRSHKQKGKSRNVLQSPMAPEPPEIVRLLEVVQLDHPDNPWADPQRMVDNLLDAIGIGHLEEAKRFQAMLTGRLAIRIRNRLIVHLLYYLGLRRGELLGFKARDLLGSSLYVLRHPDDPEDTRKYAPNAKTRDRKLPIHSGLQAMWLDYVSLVRSKFLVARRHPFLIVNHRDGAPLSFSGLAKIFDALRRVDGLPENLTPHRLRHAWNEEFSRLADEQSMDEAREVQIRAELMGWNPGSPKPTAAIYIRRKTKREAQKFSLQLQDQMMHPENEDYE